MFFLLVVVVAIVFGFVRFNRLSRNLELATLLMGIVTAAALLTLHPPARPDWRVWGGASLWIIALAAPVWWYSIWVKSLRLRAHSGVQVLPEYIMGNGGKGVSERLMREISDEAVENGIAWKPEQFSLTCQKSPREFIAQGEVELLLGRAEIKALWVENPERLKGHGSALLLKLEEEAKKRSAKIMAVSLFDWQGAEFFAKFGYAHQSEMTYPGGERRIDMTKDLA